MTEFGPISVPVTRAMLKQYADASGDHNPIHLNPEFAVSVGLPDTIAHGMLTMGLAASVLQTWFGGCAVIEEFGTRFTKPVVVPEAGTTIEFAARLIEEIGDGRSIVEVTATCGGVKVLGMARATVRQ